MMQNKTDERGFSLVEVLVALAILAVVASVTYSSLSSGALRSVAGEKQAAAIRLARSLVDMWPLQAEAVSSGEPRELADFVWRVDVEPYADGTDGIEPPASGQRPDVGSRAVPTPVLVTATIEWSDGGKEESYRLQTVRLEARR